MPDHRPLRAALSGLMVLHLLMLFALYTETEPHPPLRVAPFAIAPFLSAVMACAAAAWIMADRAEGRLLALVTAALALVSFGPQKYLDAAFADIWPAVIAAQICVATLVCQSVTKVRRAKS